MRSRILFVITALTLLLAPASASAAFLHIVAPGESLTSVAAADGLSVDALAAANGISPAAQLIAGSGLQIPPQTGPVVGAPASAGAYAGSGEEASEGAGEAAPATTTAPVSAAPAPAGSYLVQAGDTLWAIAAANGETVSELAAANGLDPAGFLIAGTTLSLTGGSSSSATATPVSSSATPVSTSATPVSTSATPVSTAGGGAQPTPETVSAADVGQVASANGVSPSLAEAIGYQESGFNNNLVSSTGATGVMQIEPGTWNYIGQNLTPPPPLSPFSAQDNIRGGVLLLRSLLQQTGGDPALTAAGYYQGLQSVRQNGMYADTQQYVGDVMALRQRFGGP